VKLAFVDCISGVSGDMLLAACLDIGWNETRLKELPNLLCLEGVKIKVSEGLKNGIRARQVEISSQSHQPFRNLEAITTILEASILPQDVKEKAVSVVGNMAASEAKVHGCGIDEVHFHEIGAVDTLIDIAGTLLAFQEMDIKRVCCSPLPLSRGFVRCSHGNLPLPAPAVLELLKDVPVYGTDEEKELVTPTGAALVKEVADTFGPMPSMKIIKTGYGAGAMDLASRPNILRIIVGTDLDEGLQAETISQIQAVIDDMTPEQLGYLLEATIKNGALDAWITPVVMKKNRSGFSFTLICQPHAENMLARFILQEGSTIGVRVDHIKRLILPRKGVTVKTRWGDVACKLITRPDGSREIVPEYDACRKIAEAHNIPIRMVYSETLKSGGGWG